MAEAKKTVKKKNGRVDTLYEGLGNARMNDDLIGRLDVSGGDIILRGRNGERDHLYPPGRAMAMHRRLGRLVQRLVMYGVAGWDVFAELADEFGSKIMEAMEQRRKLGRELPEGSDKFIAENQRLMRIVVGHGS